MTKEELDFIGAMNMCDEISNEAYQKIVNHFEETQPSDEKIKYLECNDIDVQEFIKTMKKQPLQAVQPNSMQLVFEMMNRPTSDDCVSRQAVIDLAETIQTDDYSGNEIIDVIEVDDIKALPPVTPARKQSEWYLRGGKFTCKNCEERALLKLTDATGGCREYNYYTSNFCPNCGAEMRGVEE